LKDSTRWKGGVKVNKDVSLHLIKEDEKYFAGKCYLGMDELV